MRQSDKKTLAFEYEFSLMLPNFVVYPSPTVMTVPDHRLKSPKFHFNEVLHLLKISKLCFYDYDL